MNKTKIVATIGPSSQNKEVLTQMAKNGLNVARLNMSHGDHAFHNKSLELLSEIQTKVKPLAILADLQGPKIRVEKLYIETANGKELTVKNLKKDQSWYIATKNSKNYDNFIPTSYTKLYDDVKVGDRVLFDDGLIEALVEAKVKEGKYVKIKITVGGTLKSNKGLNLPDSNVSAPSLTAKDKKDLEYVLNHKIDVQYIALSFVRTAKDVIQVKKIIEKSKKPNIKIISKIEKPEAMDNIEEIVKVSDGIMIARGDMAVELGAPEVPLNQKRIIQLCIQYAKPVITATQMLESMVENTSPTRAEASDVANSVWDGTDAVMLSAETASGKHPALVVKTMSDIIKRAESMVPRKKKYEPKDSFTGNIQLAGATIAENIKAKKIILLTKTGVSATRMSALRPVVDVVAVCNSVNLSNQLQLNWGISTLVLEEAGLKEQESLIYKELKKQRELKKLDSVVVCKAKGKEKTKGNDNLVKIEVIK